MSDLIKVLPIRPIYPFKRPLIRSFIKCDPSVQLCVIGPERATSTTVFDFSGKGNHGTINGSLLKGRGFNFDGNDYIDHGHVENCNYTKSNSFTLWWSGINNGVAWKTLLSRYVDGTERGWSLNSGTRSPAFILGYASGNQIVMPPTGITNIGNYHTIIATYDGGAAINSMKLYVNGNLSNTNTTWTVGAGTINPGTTVHLYAGVAQALAGGPGTSYTTAIANCYGVASKAITPAQVTRLHNVLKGFGR